jgi:hypothetical protein
VSFGDQNQSIFKGVELDQATLKNTSESFQVLERLGRNETGSSTSQIDIGLFNIYRSSSYQCTVRAMGNMMIQPTMYFYVKNIPLFRGSYLITEVSHNITMSGVETSFKGTRIPAESLPNPTDSFLASYRPLFDRIVNKARSIVKAENNALAANAGTAQTFIDSKGNSYVTDLGGVSFPGEHIIKEGGITDYGIPYNGANDELYIQKVIYDHTPKTSLYRPSNDKEWLRAVAVRMGGPNYPIDPNVAMNILSNLKFGSPIEGIPRIITWGKIKEFSDEESSKKSQYEFYSCKFVINGSIPLKYVTPDIVFKNYTVTEFLNPRLQTQQKYSKEILLVKNRANFSTNVYEGPINVGPSIEGYGIGLSGKLMTELGLEDGQVVYFRMT